jgi:hypothetical protein
MKKIVAGIALVLLVVLGVPLAADWYLRHLVWAENQRDFRLWQVILYTGGIEPVPHGRIAFAFYGLDGELQAKARYTINNLGMWSDHDYTVEKKPGEFRIAVLGGEQTASSVVDRSWPDLLEEKLRKIDPRYTVINCAWPDAGPEHYIQYWKTKCAPFKPDLVIVNYPETDFYRTIQGAELTYRGKPIHDSEYIRYGEARQMVRVADGTHPTSFASLDAVPSRPYGMFAPESFIFDRAAVLRMQRQMVDDMIRPLAPKQWVLLKEFLKTFKIPHIRVAEIRNFDPPKATPIDEKKLVAFGVKNFGWIARNIPDVVIVHNPSYGDIVTRTPYKLTDAMMAQDPAIKVVDARRLIPEGTGRTELRSWVLYPFMTEKWSQKGMEAYAGMMERVVLDARAGKLSTLE